MGHEVNISFSRALGNVFTFSFSNKILKLFSTPNRQNVISTRGRGRWLGGLESVRNEAIIHNIQTALSTPLDKHLNRCYARNFMP